MTPPGAAAVIETAGTAAAAAAGVEVRGATKSFPTPEGGTVHALRSVDLQIRSGEFFVLLGPSGCGKTTLLRSIAGLEVLDAGEIHVAGERIDRLPPYRRPVNTVFQSYALFPHLTVAQNVAFGLEMDGASRKDAQARVAEMLELVHMPSYAARKPSQLSGGQQQRVALARALAKSPRVLLLDEPLAALDLKLRRGMQAELKSMQRTTGITFVFVTHDQEEALSMGDRIAVFDSGSVAQVGSPEDVYERPVDRFVADFIGETNFLEVPVERDGARHVVRVAGGPATVLPDDERARAALVGDTATLAIRPERVTLRAAAAGDVPAAAHLAQGAISSLVYMGTDVRCTVSLDDGTALQVRVPPPFDSAVLTPGSRVAVDVPTEFLRPVAAALVAGEES